MRLFRIPYRMWKAWENFWFGPVDLINISLFRMAFGFLSFFMYLDRFCDRKLFFFSSGMVPAVDASGLFPSYANPLFHFYPMSDFVMELMLVAHLVLLLLVALGIGGRKITWLAFLFHIGVLQRNVSIVYGADLFTTFWLLYMSLTKSDAYFSVINLYRAKVKKIPFYALPQTSDWFSTIGMRLIQVQLCVCYAYTGLEKLKGHQWWEGSAVWHVMGNSQLVFWDFSYLNDWPVAIAVLTFMTLIFEVYFPALVWNPYLRKSALIVGVTFHLSTAVFMGLPYFASVMVFTYILFLDPVWLHDVRSKVLRRISL